MEIKIENYMNIIIGAVTTIFIIIVIWTEAGVITTLLLIGSIAAIIIAAIKLQKEGKLEKTHILKNKMKNYYMIKKLRNPQLRGLTQEEYKQEKENAKNREWKVKW